MYIGTVKVKGREYVRVLKSKRVDGMPRPQVVATLGNLETFRKSIPTIIRGLHRLLGDDAPEAAIELENLDHAECGVTLAARALWEELGLTPKLRQCFRARSPQCPTEVLVRTMVTNRLSDPCSKLGIARWPADATMGTSEDRYLDRFREDDPVQLADRFYKAMDSLLRHRPAIERHLFHRLKDLFHLDVDVVFYDLTSSYFEGSQAEYGWFGYSRDERRHNLQIVVGLILVDGFPVSHHVFKGYRRDATCLETALERIRRRFKIRRVIFVGDRGLLTEKNVQRLRGDHEYILACRKRRDRHTRRALRARPSAAAKARGGKKKTEPVIWSVDATDGDRLIGHMNPARAFADEERRKDILEVFREELCELQRRFRVSRRDSRDDRIRKVSELLVRRKGLGKRYFAVNLDNQDHLTYRTKQWVLDYDDKIDGTTILKTNNRTLTDEEVVARYKELARVERAFRDLKSVIDLRPIYHRKARRIAAHGSSVSWRSFSSAWRGASSKRPRSPKRRPRPRCTPSSACGFSATRSTASRSSA
jgi:DDE family transposase